MIFKEGPVRWLRENVDESHVWMNRSAVRTGLEPDLMVHYLCTD